MYEYKAKVISVYDGDTVTCEVDLGFHIKMVEKFRLSRIDAPEVRGKSREDGLKSRDFLRSLVLAKSVTIKSKKKGKYGRYIADIYIGGECVNDMLVQNNYAVYKSY